MDAPCYGRGRAFPRPLHFVQSTPCFVFGTFVTDSKAAMCPHLMDQETECLILVLLLQTASQASGAVVLKLYITASDGASRVPQKPVLSAKQ